ncbi:VPDSG-CTERM sorting domain-containing protein [Pelagicoccus sp. SDUM812005]|uniref:VPDSG-CTERM sorting domain-containing protein n=1 Tax=Pelagicoccus sp. SDUM812005 TaxID=3041257 RepID=UPI00280C8ACE|nr:VPDSG-CTERM sorting domain-containing protein [Pelagicoccus sp. SDUM812005]MDQ8182008.1 VPDSG-CTERM sorting domain-containing protein [Pelagicoccus sp. SDUM812005]
MKIEKILGAKLCLLSAIALLFTPCAHALTLNDVWINEIHYDNTGGDVGEFVEIAGLAGTDLSPLTLEFYNGSGGAKYKTFGLSGSLSDAGNGYGFQSFLISGIQNGSPDGIALVYGSLVLQFLSYEGSFAASNGAANGLTSINIGVNQPDDTDLGLSLQFQGHAGNGSWTGPIASTSGAINTGQTLPALKSDSDSASVPDSGTTVALLGLSFATLLTLKRRRA